MIFRFVLSVINRDRTPGVKRWGSTLDRKCDPSLSLSRSVDPTLTPRLTRDQGRPTSAGGRRDEWPSGTSVRPWSCASAFRTCPRRCASGPASTRGSEAARWSGPSVTPTAAPTASFDASLSLLPTRPCPPTPAPFRTRVVTPWATGGGVGSLGYSSYLTRSVL